MQAGGERGGGERVPDDAGTSPTPAGGAWRAGRAQPGVGRRGSLSDPGLRQPHRDPGRARRHGRPLRRSARATRPGSDPTIPRSRDHGRPRSAGGGRAAASGPGSPRSSLRHGAPGTGNAQAQPGDPPSWPAPAAPPRRRSRGSRRRSIRRSPAKRCGRPTRRASARCRFASLPPARGRASPLAPRVHPSPRWPRRTRAGARLAASRIRAVARNQPTVAGRRLGGRVGRRRGSCPRWWCSSAVAKPSERPPHPENRSRTRGRPPRRSRLTFAAKPKDELINSSEASAAIHRENGNPKEGWQCRRSIPVGFRPIGGACSVIDTALDSPRPLWNSTRLSVLDQTWVTTPAAAHLLPATVLPPTSPRPARRLIIEIARTNSHPGTNEPKT